MSQRGDRRYPLFARVPWPLFARRPEATPVPTSGPQDAVEPAAVRPTGPPQESLPAVSPVLSRPTDAAAAEKPSSPAVTQTTSKPAGTTKVAGPQSAAGRTLAMTTPAVKKTAVTKTAVKKTAATKTAVKKTAATKTAAKQTAAKETAAKKAAPDPTPTATTVVGAASPPPTVSIPPPAAAPRLPTVEVTPAARPSAPAARSAVVGDRTTNEDGRFWSPDRVEHPRWVPRRSFVAVAAVVLLAGLGVTFALTRQDDRPRGTQVLGVRLSTPQPDAAPQTSTASAAMAADGQVTVTETWVWPDAIPLTIEVRQPDLQGLSGIPSGTRVTASRPDASVDGSPLSVTAAGDGSWRLAVPPGAGHGVVLVRYRLSGTVHTDPQSPPQRALAVVALAPQTSSAGVPRQLILPAANVLNVACPSADGGPVVLCATRTASTWVVTLPPGGSVALAQLNVTG